MASFACDTLELVSEGKVLHLSLNRPEVRNAFNAQVIADLTRFAQWLSEPAQKDYRVVFLSGKGKFFCSGADLNWMKESLSWSKQENYADTQKLSNMLTLINEAPLPIVGLVHGGAFGGGVGLVSICDHVVATRESLFSLSEVRIGLIPACIGPFMVDKIGLGHCRSLFISGERFSAAKAFEIGLINEVVENQKELQQTQKRLSEAFLHGSPAAIRAAKKFLRSLKSLNSAQAAELGAQTLAELRVGAEAQEGIRSFLEKRKPTW